MSEGIMVRSVWGQNAFWEVSVQVLVVALGPFVSRLASPPPKDRLFFFFVGVVIQLSFVCMYGILLEYISIVVRDLVVWMKYGIHLNLH